MAMRSIVTKMIFLLSAIFLTVLETLMIDLRLKIGIEIGFGTAAETAV